MIKGEFSQSVTIDGTSVYTTGMQVKEQYDGIVPVINFRLHSEVNPGIESLISIGGRVVVVQSDGVNSVTHVAEISKISSSRNVDEDAYDIEALGEADRLRRKRITKLYGPNISATQAVLQIMADLSVGVSSAGVGNNTQNIGAIELKQETALDSFIKISRRTGWAFQVIDGVLNFFDPLQRSAPFNIESLENLERSTLRISEDVSSVFNVVRSEAYEYKDVNYTTPVSGCQSSAPIPGISHEYEIVEEPVITSPSHLAGTRGTLTRGAGQARFNRNFDSDTQDPKDRTLNVAMRYRARRRLMAEKRDVASIALYGERVGAFSASNGSDDIDTVFEKMTAELERKAFPHVTGSCRVLKLGLRPGMVLSVVPVGSIQPRTVIVNEVNTAVQGADCEVSISFSSRSYFIAEPQIDMVERIDNLEKQGLSTQSFAGKVIEEIQPIQDTPTIPPETIEVDSTTEAIVTVFGEFNGGGKVTLTGQRFKFGLGTFTGGGGINFDTVAIQGTVFVVTGGGEFKYNSTKISGVRLNQNVITI